MPVQSMGQLRKMFALAQRGELKGGVAKAKEMAHSTPNISKLPERLRRAAHGGMMRHYYGGGYANDMRQDEDVYDHAVQHEEYGPQSAENYARGGMASCPNCGYSFSRGGEATEEGEQLLDENERNYADGEHREYEGLSPHVESEHVGRFAHAIRMRRR